MIKRLQVLHYKAFKYIDINLSNFNILVGPNASGKSTLLDIFILIKDILLRGPIFAIEKRAPSLSELLWLKKENRFDIAIEIEIPLNIKEKLMHKSFSIARYEISIQQDKEKGAIIGEENLWLKKEQLLNSANNSNESLKYSIKEAKEKYSSNHDLYFGKQRELFPAEKEEPKNFFLRRTKPPSGWRKIIIKSIQGNDYFRAETTDWNITYKFGPYRSALARMPEDEERFPASLWIRNLLMDGIDFLQLESRRMRMLCPPDVPAYFLPNGSNLPKVAQHLKSNQPNSFRRWIKHIQTALPEVCNIEIEEKPENRFLFLNFVHKNGLKLPSWVISDGTLRLLAQTIIAYLPERNRIYMIEEPENGLHPLAIESLYQSLSSIYENQIFMASHSPIILGLTEPKYLLCFSKTESGAVDIVRGNEHPKLKEWKKNIDLAALHASGILQ